MQVRGRNRRAAPTLSQKGAHLAPERGVRGAPRPGAASTLRFIFLPLDTGIESPRSLNRYPLSPCVPGRYWGCAWSVPVFLLW